MRAARQAAPPDTEDRDQRVAALVRAHIGLVWRTLRRLGVPEADLEDAMQKVFIVVSEKLLAIELGREQSYVFGTAMRVASEFRRRRRRWREESLGALERHGDGAPAPDDQAQTRRKLALVADILAGMPEELAATFLLYEFEQMTMTEIAELHAVPRGTVASRLRRAREAFRDQADKLQDGSGS